jgi:hypothetical protein
VRVAGRHAASWAASHRQALENTGYYGLGSDNKSQQRDRSGAAERGAERERKRVRTWACSAAARTLPKAGSLRRRPPTYALFSLPQTFFTLSPSHQFLTACIEY